MNKTLLAILITSSLALMACSKQEAPEQSAVEASNPASEPLQPLGASSVTAVDIDRQQTDNTTTETRREYYDFQQKAAAEQAANNAVTADEGTNVQNQNAEKQSEDDAVAAALAAANPALNNNVNSSPKPAPAQPQSAPQ